MISAVSNVNFRGEGAQDIINAPGKFSVQPSVKDMPADSFEKSGKKSHTGLKLIATALIAAGAFLGLGYAAKSGKLGKLEKIEIEEGAKFLDKAMAKIKNAGIWVGEKAKNSYEAVAGLFNKGAKAAEKSAKDFEEVK